MSSVTFGAMVANPNHRSKKMATPSKSPVSLS